ncbi:unnamed protein product [Chrysoparadoxa australica]
MSIVQSWPTGSPLDAISLSLDLQFAVVGGRDALTVLSLEQGKMSSIMRLSVTTKGNVKSSITDIKFGASDMSAALVAGGLKNGGVIVWDLQAERKVSESGTSSAAGSAGKMLGASMRSRIGSSIGGGAETAKIMVEHQRAVNCVCWHPSEANLLLSGSMDNTIKLWDRRGRSYSCQTTFKPRRTAVRDVQFNPFNSHRFAVGFESGQLHVWDRRKPNQPEVKVEAHTQPVYAVDWHPSQEWHLATGSRDRTVRVWDLSNAQTSEPQVTGVGSSAAGTVGIGTTRAQSVHTLHCSGPVGRCKWRPGHPQQLCTCSNTDSMASDTNVYIYDVTQPFVPLAVLEGASDVCTGIEWCDTPVGSDINEERRWDIEAIPGVGKVASGSSDGDAPRPRQNFLGAWQHVLACSKDGVVRVHSCLRSMRPRELIAPSSLSLCASGGLSYVQDSVERRLEWHGLYCNSNTNKGLGFFREQPVGLARAVDEGTTSGPSVGDDEERAGGPDSGTTAVSAASPTTAASSWSRMVDDNFLARSPTISPFLRGKNFRQGSPPVAESGFMKPRSELVMLGPQVKPLFDGRRRQSVPAQVASKQSSAEAVRWDGKVGPLLVEDVTGYDPKLVKYLAEHYVLRGAALHEICGYNAACARSCGLLRMWHTWQMLLILLDGSICQPPTGQEQLLRQQDAAAADATAGSTGEGTNLQQVQELTMGKTLALLENQRRTNARGPAAASHGMKRSRGWGVAGRGKPVEWLWKDVLESFLKECIEAGDVQHCVAVCEVIRGWYTGPELEGHWHGLAIPSEVVREWYMSYIGLLDTLQAWQRANELIKQSDDTFIQSYNQAGTTVHMNCAVCRSSSGQGARCAKCSSVVTLCSLCQVKQARPKPLNLLDPLY